MTGTPNTLFDLRNRTAGLLGQLQALADRTGPGGKLLDAMLQPDTDDNSAAIRDGALALAKSLEHLQGQLAMTLIQLEQVEYVHPQVDLGSETYWSELNEALCEAAACSSDARFSLWLKSFAEAFAAWRLDVCEVLVHEERWAGQQSEDFRQNLSSSIEVLRSDDRHEAVVGLESMLDQHPAGLLESPLDDTSRAAALITLGRIRLYDNDDDAEALRCFEDARKAAPEDGRVYAALAEYYLKRNDEVLARDLFSRAIEVSPDRPAGYVGMALWCEAQAWWDEAQSWYAQAVEIVLHRAASGDPLAQLGQLLAPVSGALYLRLAITIVATNKKTGLAAVNEAIRLGVKGEGSYPVCKAFQVKGEVLEALDDTHEASDAFCEAAKYNSWGHKAEAACRLHERANRLDPELLRNYWYWADALLVAGTAAMPSQEGRDKIVQSRDVWSRGRDISPPDEVYSWSYLTRAIIAAQLAEFPEADQCERLWEAIAFVEQGLLLDPLRAYSWVTLGRAHYGIGNYLSALEATETALLCDPDDVGAIEQRIVTLANLNHYSETRRLVAKRSTRSPQVTGWLNAVDANVTLKESARGSDSQGYEVALIAANAARSAGWDRPWSSIDRAQILHLAGHIDEAQQQYEELLSKFDERDTGDRHNFAWAALMTGEYDKAFRILSDYCGDCVTRPSAVQRQLGFCQLLRGELESAREYFDRAVEIANSRYELETWLNSDIQGVEVLHLLEGRSYFEAAREMLDQCRDSAIERRSSLQFPSSPLEEAQCWAAGLESKDETDCWTWIGAQATIGRLKLKTQRWHDASKIYRDLKKSSRSFCVTQRGLALAFHGLVVHGAAQAQSGHESMRVTAEDSLPEDRTQLAVYDDQIAGLERRRRLTRVFGQTGLKRLPAVSSIVLEAAQNLEGLLKGGYVELEPTFESYMDATRWALEDLLGVPMPSVRVRIDESYLPDGTYIILIKGIPLVSGNISLSQGLCGETVDRLLPLDIKAEEAVNPANGSECAWVKMPDWQNVKDAGLQLWTPVEYIVLHLAAVIRKNLTELVRIQEIADLLKDRAKEQYTTINSAPGGLARFTNVVQALLAEEVPIKDLPSISDCYLSCMHLPTYEIPEEIRCMDAVRWEILGNSPDTPFYLLGEKFVSLIIQGIQRDGEEAVLALEPEPTQEALTAIRNEVAKLRPMSRNLVLIVEDWRIRPFVRKLVELEFPHLAVLSRREALVPDSMPPLATIEVNSLEAPDRY